MTQTYFYHDVRFDDKKRPWKFNFWNESHQSSPSHATDNQPLSGENDLCTKWSEGISLAELDNLKKQTQRKAKEIESNIQCQIYD